MVVAIAIGSALLYAVAAVTQQRAASAQPMERALRLSLLIHLLARPLWLLGLACDIGGFLLQFWALDHGSLVLVQPLLVSGLLFALPLGALVAKAPIRGQDLIAALLTVSGLAVFLLVAQPDEGRPDASPMAWALLVPIVLAVSGTMVFTAQRSTGARRAGLLAAAAGTMYGLTAALTKASAHLLDEGLKHLFTSWKPYALTAMGITGTVVDQSSYQAGPLNWSLPILTIADPLVSIAIGAFVLGEGINVEGIAPFVEAVALIVMSIGVFQLSTAPAVAQVREDKEEAPEEPESTEL